MVCMAERTGNDLEERIIMSEDKKIPHITGDAGFSVFEPAKGEPREKILKLGQKITDRIGHKVTVDDPEYWGLAAMVTDEMADVANLMQVRKPKTLAELVKMTGKSSEELEPLLQEMSNIGLLEFNWENPTHTKQYVLPPFVPGSAEFFNMKLKQIEEHPEIASMFERMTFLPLAKITPMVPLGGAGIGMHVIPVEKAIEAQNESVKLEHISYWLSKYEGKYAKSPCSCRYSRGVMGEGCADDPENWCIGVGDMADYLVETNKGTYCSKEEVFSILEQAEKNGYVHQITNIDGSDKIFAICNCNIKVCNALRTSQLFNTPNMSRSAYVAHVDKKNCVACGRCVEYCPAGAVKLGQKLCKKDHSEVQYPKQELPDATKWGPDKWSYDYRDRNRINCYDTGTAPCKTACPAHIAVQGYLKMASQGRYAEALALIKKENPFPAICGRVCNKRCEDACTRGTIDEAVAIDDVKKFLAELDLHADTRYVPEKVIPSTRGEFAEKIAIIGGGPAGLSCAYYLAVTGYRPTVFEKSEKPGGMLRYGIPSYKLEKNVIDAEIDIIRELGVEIRCNTEIGKDITIEELREQGYKAFYMAIGCQDSRKINLKNDDAKGIMSAIDLLHATSADENYEVKGRTVVIGGGNVAMDVARVSKRCHSEKIDLFCLESEEEMPASKDEILEAQEEGVSIHCGWGVKSIQAEDGHVTSVTLKKCIALKDAEGRFNPSYDENETMDMACDNLFFSIGQSIAWNDLLKGTAVKLKPNQGPIADTLTYQTEEKDIFVGGDVFSGPSFAINAIAAGKQGAESLHRYVHNASLTVARDRREFIELNKEDFYADGYDTAGRQYAGMEEKKTLSFRDTHKTLTEEQVRTETARCLGCGASIVDEHKCIGCGLCTTKCEFDAIHLFRDLPKASTMTRSEDKMKAILPYMVKRQFKILTKKEK